MSLLSDIQFEFVWRNLNAIMAEQARELWIKYDALSPEQIEERIPQVAVIIRHQEQGVVGLSTIRPLRLQLFNDNVFYEFRCFIAPEYRAAALDTKLLVTTKEYLEKNNYEAAAGMLMVIENEMIKANWTKAVWPGPDMIFAGYTKQGHHIRISYFKKARI